MQYEYLVQRWIHMNVLTIILGILVVLFGRKFFWLFVGFTGFLVGFELVQQVLGPEDAMVKLVLALVIGIIGALLAVFVQKLAFFVAGFIGGGYVAWHLLGLFAVESPQINVLVTFAGAILGAVLIWGIVDYALIVFSSVVGALAVVTETMPQQPLDIIIFVVLVVVGLVVQTRQLHQDKDSEE